MSIQAISQYLQAVQQQLSTGHAQEHSYRPALEVLFKSLITLHVVNEPKGSEHGRPDFIFLKGEIPIAWVEAKDLHVNLDKIEKSEQMTRYFGYPNLILTNGLEFRFYKNGQSYGEPVAIARKNGQTIMSFPEIHDLFARTFAAFVEEPTETIRSAQHLAKIMGGKARRLRDNVVEMLTPDFKGQRGDIESVMQVLKTKLIHDLTPESFADLYAQTLVYGLFVARYNDKTKDSFSRTEARDTIPASNHLLQQFFDHIAGANFVKKLSYIVDELCDVFAHADVHGLVHGLYQQMKLVGETHDPIIHFYEDFLREYNPELRLQRGVFYTPLPVVRYIVRSVDALLKEHFDLKDGIADRTQIEWARTEQGKTSKIQIDKVQILDPAVGTGTFLNEVIRHIHTTFKGQEGMWPAYVNDHLIPRLNGFELMMASYTIAHLKLSMTLAETGITDIRKRLRVFLTNSLEEAPEKDRTLFAPLGLDGALTEEGEMADEVKRDLPIMVVLGNPPYSVSSQNASTEIGTDGKKRKTWIGALLDDYKKDLNEKKINLDDDYIKFIRFSHHLVEKNGQGIVAMITNNSFLDGITHRRMRQSLLETFNHIYVLDLHGNSKRKEKAPDGGKDENVFDIQQGVSITLFARTDKKKKGELAQVHHFDLFGKQERKYEWLDGHDVQNTEWQKLTAPEPAYFFVPKDFSAASHEQNELSLANIFMSFGNGIGTDRDSLFYDFKKDVLEKRIQTFYSMEGLQSPFCNDFSVKDSSSYKLIERRKKTFFSPEFLHEATYRPFDLRSLYYNANLTSRPAFEVMRNLLHKNFALLITRQISTGNFHHVFVSKTICDRDPLSLATRERTQVFPLYLYPNSSTLSTESRTANLNLSLLSPALQKLHLEWIPDGTGNGKTKCGPEDIFDYIYAILHSPTYRIRYKEFLKIDFPRVPFTSNTTLFWELVKKGRDIRLLHLLESPLLNTLVTRYPIVGKNIVGKVRYDDKEKRVYINELQYFEGIEPGVWNFPIGGYQPLQKWLKDRKDREVTSDDILHWQKVVVALKETNRLMQEIDPLVEQNGGWPMQ